MKPKEEEHRDCNMEHMKMVQGAIRALCPACVDILVRGPLIVTREYTNQKPRVKGKG
jgi:hypothetical protein